MAAGWDGKRVPAFPYTCRMPATHVADDEPPDPVGAPTAYRDLVRRALRASVRHPGVTGEALRALLATARRGWWRRPPFLPLPAPDYVAWRTETAYGTSSADTPESDLYHFLEWRRRQRRMR